MNLIYITLLSILMISCASSMSSRRPASEVTQGESNQTQTSEERRVLKFKPIFKVEKNSTLKVNQSEVDKQTCELEFSIQSNGSAGMSTNLNIADQPNRLESLVSHDHYFSLPIDSNDNGAFSPEIRRSEYADHRWQWYPKGGYYETIVTLKTGFTAQKKIFIDPKTLDVTLVQMFFYEGPVKKPVEKMKKAGSFICIPEEALVSMRN